MSTSDGLIKIISLKEFDGDYLKGSGVVILLALAHFLHRGEMDLICILTFQLWKLELRMS